jgi:cytochrome c553
MKRKLLGLSIIALIGVFGQVQAAGDMAAGKTKADSCKGCHGANGEGVGKFPALAGHKAEDTVQALNDFKSGKRVNPMMKTFAGKLSDDDMANVAAFYASLPKKN